MCLPYLKFSDPLPDTHLYFIWPEPPHVFETVNSEFFARVLFSRNFAYAKFRENEILAKSLCRLLIKENHALFANFSVANMSYNAFREIEIHAKFPDLQYLSQGRICEVSVK